MHTQDSAKAAPKAKDKEQAWGNCEDEAESWIPKNKQEEGKQ